MNAIVRTKDHLTDAAENATDKLLSIIDEKSQAAKSELEHLIGSCNSCGKAWTIRANGFSNKSLSLRP
jgi:hypothetical protein